MLITIVTIFLCAIIAMGIAVGLYTFLSVITRYDCKDASFAVNAPEFYIPPFQILNKVNRLDIIYRIPKTSDVPAILLFCGLGLLWISFLCLSLAKIV